MTTDEALAVKFRAIVASLTRGKEASPRMLIRLQNSKRAIVELCAS